MKIIREGEHTYIELGKGALSYSGQDPAQTLSVGINHVQFNTPLITSSVGYIGFFDSCAVQVAVKQGSLEANMPKGTLMVRAGEKYLIHLSNQENSACGTRTSPQAPMQAPPYEKIIRVGLVLITIVAVIKAWESPDSP